MIGHSCSTVPLKKSLVRLPHCATVQTHVHLALLSSHAKDITYAFSWKEEMYDAVVQQIARRAVRQDASAHVHHCGHKLSGQSGYGAKIARSDLVPPKVGSGVQGCVGFKFRF